MSDFSTPLFNNISTCTHDGKVIAVASAEDGILRYTVRQSGFEDTAVVPTETHAMDGFEKWQLLPLDRSTDDPSVTAYEQQNLAYADGNPIMRSIFAKEAALSGTGRVKMLSVLNHLYIFRLSAKNRLTLNRFILDGMANELVPKLDVRFHRSEQKLVPEGRTNGVGGGELDTLSYRNTKQKPFFEPALELSFLGEFNPAKPWFSVELLPTNEHDKHRWHFFVYIDEELRLFSVAASEEGLVDLFDQQKFQQDPDKIDKKVTVTLDGIVERVIELKGEVAEGFDSSTYSNQVARMTKAGEEFLKDGMRVMLAVPLRQAPGADTLVASLSFNVSTLGLLAQIAPAPDGEPDKLVGKEIEVLLPPTTLDEIKLIADRTPPPSGDIAGVSESNGLLSVTAAGEEDAELGVQAGQNVRIWGTQSYDGTYIATAVNKDAGSFEIAAKFTGEDPRQGHWEVVEDDDAGLVFENMIASYKTAPEGKITITCFSHNIREGDEIRIEGTQAHDGVFPINDVGDDNSFTIDRPWPTGDVVNLRLRPRSGLSFDGDGDYLLAGPIDVESNPPRDSLQRTFCTWVYIESHQGTAQTIATTYSGLFDLVVNEQGHLQLTVEFADLHIVKVIDPEPMVIKEWLHVAAIIDFRGDEAGDTNLQLLRAGQVVAEELVRPLKSLHLPVNNLFLNRNSLPIASRQYSMELPQAMTIEGWISPVVVGRGVIASWLQHGQFELAVTGEPGGHKLEWMVNGVVIRGAVTLDMGHWYHVAATYNPQTGLAQLFVGGEADGQTTVPASAIEPVFTFEDAEALQQSLTLGALGGVVSPGYANGFDVALIVSGSRSWRQTGLKTWQEYYPGDTPVGPELHETERSWESLALSANDYDLRFDIGSRFFKYRSAFNQKTASGPWVEPAEQPLSDLQWFDWKTDTVTERFQRTSSITWQMERENGAIEVFEEYHRAGRGIWIKYLSTVSGEEQDFLVRMSMMLDDGEPAAAFQLAKDMGHDEFADLLAQRVAEFVPGNDDAMAFLQQLMANLPDDSMQSGSLMEDNWAQIDFAEGLFKLADTNMGTVENLVFSQVEDPTPATLTRVNSTEDQYWELRTPSTRTWAERGPDGIVGELYLEIDRTDTTVNLRQSEGTHKIVLDTGNRTWTRIDDFVETAEDTPFTVYTLNHEISGDNRYQGYLADVRVWQTVRTPAQLRNNAAVALSGAEPDLTALWPLAETSSSQGTDLTRNKVHLDLTDVQNNAVATEDGPALSNDLSSWAGMPHRAPGQLAHYAGNSYQESCWLAASRDATGFLHGMLSEVEVWVRNPSPDDIQRRMHLQLSGRERGLRYYWRCAGLLAHPDSGSALRVTPDRGPHGLDAVVMGDVYVSARELPRRNSAGLAVRYSNVDLVAVTQGASYTESFEFRATALDGYIWQEDDLNNADGRGNRLFSLRYWGQKSRTSEDVIEFSASSSQQSKFEDLENGWFRVSAQVTIPDGVSLMRSFEIDQVRGISSGDDMPPEDWARLSIRRHRLVLNSKTISHSHYRDELMHLPFANNATATSTADQKRLPILERSEARTLRSISYLTEILEMFNDLPGSEKERAELLEEINQIKADIRQEDIRVDLFENDPLNFVLGLYSSGSAAWLTERAGMPEAQASARHGASGLVIEQTDEQNLFTIRQWDQERYLAVRDYVETRTEMVDVDIIFGLIKVGEREVSENVTISNQAFFAAGNESGRFWRLHEVQNGVFLFANTEHDGVYLSSLLGHVFCLPKPDKGLSLLTSNTRYSQWALQPIDGSRPIGYARRLEVIKQRGDSLRKRLRKQESRVAMLTRALDASEQEKNRLKELLGTLRTRANGLHIERENNLLSQLGNTQTQSTPGVMSLVAQDRQGLKTYGSLLASASPATAVTTAATAEGNVQLSYFDTRGRMRFSNYDATSDSKNHTFEQWLETGTDLAINLHDPEKDRLVLEGSPVNLPASGHTVEAWFYYPLPVPAAAFDNAGQGVQITATGDTQPYFLSYLTSNASGSDAAIAIAKGRRLGTVADGFFHDAGVDLEEHLDIGWHHVAVKTRGATTAWFLDGMPKGYLAAPLRFATTMPVGGFTATDVAGFTNACTFQCWFWLDGSQGRLRQLVLFSKKFGNIVVGDTTVYVTINESTWFSANLPGFAQGLSVKRWINLALTYSPTNVVLYLDGWALAPMEISLNSRAESIDIELCKSSVDAFRGDLSNVQLWNRKLSADEVRENMFVLPPPDANGLVAHWPMSVARVGDQMLVRDVSKRELHLKSAPGQGSDASSRQLVPAISGSVTTLGNRSTGGAPAGRLSQLRFWSVPLDDEEIRVNALVNLTGNEPDLLACYPLDDISQSSKEARSLTGNPDITAKLKGGNPVVLTAPVGNPGVKVAGFESRPGEVSKTGLQLDGVSLSGSFTIECWVKREHPEPGKFQTIFYTGTLDPEVTVNIMYRPDFEKGSIWAQVDEVPTWFHVGNKGVEEWMHIACVHSADDNSVGLYLDGSMVSVQQFSQPLLPAGTTLTEPLHIGYDGVWNQLDGLSGQMAEFRVWDTARTPEQIEANFDRRVRGDEPELLVALPLDDEFDRTPIRNLVSGGSSPIMKHGQLRSFRSDNLPLVPGPGLVTAEYSTVGAHPLDKDARRAVLRRFFTFVRSNGHVQLLPGKRIEELMLKWIGNAQFEPTLLGYIEGPPPVPSENLTIDEDYDGGTSVELSLSEEVEYSWNRSTDIGGGLDINAFVGGAWDVSAGVVINSRVTEGQVGARATVNTEWRREASSNIRAQSTRNSRDELELRGSVEMTPAFPHLGNRYVPKNVGYALVVSGMADVFITQMKRTRRMVAYEVRPVEDMPPDVNTITFLINPAYTLNGSLDGQVGSHAAHPRFYRHVPQMRAQHGSRYPASYFNLQQAYDLKRQIERMDMDRESFFAGFESEKVMGLDDGLLDQIPAAGERPRSELGGIADEHEGPAAGPDDDGRSKEDREDESADQLKKKYEKSREQKEKEAEKRVSDIENRFSDQNKSVEATSAFKAWQRRMENLQLSAAKRNIQNTYVWDADGGIHYEEESFANTIEHTIGGSFNLNASLGLDLSIGIGNFKGELQAMGTLAMSQTMTKSRSATRSFELNVRLDRVERRGITDANDYPISPGEKVDRYRFMSFYLEGNTDHFHDFFNTVVDPEWLLSNDEEARALRQIAHGKPNKAWRVLHRVTYVERPALLGFGNEVNAGSNVEQATKEVFDYFDSLEEDNADLRSQILALSAEVKKIGASLQGGGGGGVVAGSPASLDPVDTGNTPPVGGTGQSQGSSSGSGLAELNSATLQELESLNGIGPALAVAIVNHREAQGAFVSVDELVEISGIGPALLRHLKPQLAGLRA